MVGATADTAFLHRECLKYAGESCSPLPEAIDRGAVRVIALVLADRDRAEWGAILDRQRANVAAMLAEREAVDAAAAAKRAATVAMTAEFEAGELLDEKKRKAAEVAAQVEVLRAAAAGVRDEMKAPRPMYRLDALAGAPGEPVVVVEGERCADALAAVGILATSVMGGADAVGVADLSPLEGRRVILWRDNDPAGEAWLEALTGRLRTLGVETRTVPIPADVPPKWDCADALADGWTPERIRDLIDKAPAPPRRLHAVELDLLLKLSLPSRELILDPWLPTQGICMVYAARGVGKTHLALGVAVAVSRGGEFLRWKAPTPRRVLYLDGEMPAVALQERLGALIGTGPRPSPGFLRIVTPDLQENGIPDLATVQGREAVEEWLADGVDLVVVDNLSTLVRTGAENEAEGWLPIQEWTLALRRRRISTLLIHHAGKSGAQRGTSRREDVLDSSIVLRHPADYTPTDGARFEIHFDKARGCHGADVKPFEAALSTTADGAEWTVKDLEDRLAEQIAELIEDGLREREIIAELKISRATYYRQKKRAAALGLIFETGFEKRK